MLLQKADAFYAVSKAIWNAFNVIANFPKMN